MTPTPFPVDLEEKRPLIGFLRCCHLTERRRNEAGQPDSVAWTVRDRRRWLDLLAP